MILPITEQAAAIPRDEADWPPVSPWRAALRCRCPRCGAGSLYEGVLQVTGRCVACGLDLRAQDSGDGPAVFVILLLGALVVPLALVLEVRAAPPLWLHVMIWTPVILGLAAILLRVLKAFLVGQQYRHKSGEAGADELR